VKLTELKLKRMVKEALDEMDWQKGEDAFRILEKHFGTKEADDVMSLLEKAVEGAAKGVHWHETVLLGPDAWTEVEEYTPDPARPEERGPPHPHVPEWEKW
jgi:hypothetical protein